MTYELYLGDCLQEMNRIADHSIDAIICDPPYGTTACAWDSVIPFESMWEQLKRVIKPRGAIVLFGSQPFTSALIMSNAEWFKYCWVWEKNIATGYGNANKIPLKSHEDISVFYKNQPIYNPQELKKANKLMHRSGAGRFMGKSGLTTGMYVQEYENYPKQIIRFDIPPESLHPTQKPVDLLAYLIRTYTNEGETVLDFTMGSGSTGVAAMQTGRNFIGIELDENYFSIAKKRIEDAARAAQGQPKQLIGSANDYADAPLFAQT